MKIFSDRQWRGHIARLLLCLGGGLAVFNLGRSAWVGTRSNSDAVVTPAVAARLPTQANGQHSTGKVHFDLLAKLLADDRRSAPPGDWLRELSDPKANFRVETQSHPLLGRIAPDFTLFDARNRPWTLQTQLERGPVVVVFYLGYYCNVCVHHLFELNADLDRFRALGAEVVAISGDSPELSRAQFARYGDFKFSVLSDTDHAAATLFSVFHAAMANSPEQILHGTFLIARDGHVHWANCGETPFANHKALFFELARLEGRLPPSDTTPGLDEEGTKKP